MLENINKEAMAYNGAQTLYRIKETLHLNQELLSSQALFSVFSKNESLNSIMNLGPIFIGFS